MRLEREKRKDIEEQARSCFFDDGDRIEVMTEDARARFLLISGKPIGEPVAWSGPIVMNTQEEPRIAFEEYRNGTFIRHGPPELFL